MTANADDGRSQAGGSAAGPVRARTDVRPVILFDGICNLCNASVRFVVRRDPTGMFRFASLQSERGRRLLRGNGLPVDDLSSIVLVDDERCYVKSDAALRIVRALRWPWPVLVVFSIVPRRVRDCLYEYIARNRYRWFGKQDACEVPRPELAERFLD
jgi:predicted DCC family thiol-disulfide oxidoreductase YuxK